MLIEKYLEVVVKQRGSDLHISAGLPPVVRIDGQLQRMDVPALKPEEVELLLKNPSFKRQMDRGFYVIHNDKALHTESLEKKDGSAQYKAEDFEDMGQKAPTSSKSDELTEDELLESEQAQEQEEKLRKRGRPSKKLA